MISEIILFINLNINESQMHMSKDNNAREYSISKTYYNRIEISRCLQGRTLLNLVLKRQIVQVISENGRNDCQIDVQSLQLLPVPTIEDK